MFGSARPACVGKFRPRQRLLVMLLALSGMSAAGLLHPDQDSDSARVTPQVNVEMSGSASDRSINLYLSTYLDNPDDGKVSVASARLEGMCAMLVLSVSHPFIMKDKETIAQTINYLENGRFTSAKAEYPDCKFRNPI